jgi:hypothetical protein
MDGSSKRALTRSRLNYRVKRLFARSQFDALPESMAGQLKCRRCPQTQDIMTKSKKCQDIRSTGLYQVNACEQKAREIGASSADEGRKKKGLSDLKD